MEQQREERQHTSAQVWVCCRVAWAAHATSKCGTSLFHLDNIPAVHLSPGVGQVEVCRRGMCLLDPQMAKLCKLAVTVSGGAVSCQSLDCWAVRTAAAGSCGFFVSLACCWQVCNS